MKKRVLLFVAALGTALPLLLVQPAQAHYWAGDLAVTADLSFPAVPCWSCSGTWSGDMTGAWAGLDDNDVQWEVAIDINKSGNLHYSIDDLACPAINPGSYIGGNFSSLTGVTGTYGTQQVKGVSGGFQLIFRTTPPVSVLRYGLYLITEDNAVHNVIDFGAQNGVGTYAYTSVPACDGGPATGRLVSNTAG